MKALITGLVRFSQAHSLQRELERQWDWGVSAHKFQFPWNCTSRYYAANKCSSLRMLSFRSADKYVTRCRTIKCLSCHPSLNAISSIGIILRPNLNQLATNVCNFCYADQVILILLKQSVNYIVICRQSGWARLGKIVACVIHKQSVGRTLC